MKFSGVGVVGDLAGENVFKGIVWKQHILRERIKATEKQSS